MFTVPPLLSLVGVSGYGLWISYNNIVRLQKYEAKSEKAAEWSNEAAERLHTTRTTQGAAAITIGLSLITSLTLLFLNHAEQHQIVLSISLINTSICLGARFHMADYWRQRTMVPFVQDYNEAIKGSNIAVNVLGLLGAGWIVTGLVGWFLG
ncbi:hypothetical protein BCR34DRAFT_627836 [Clohesyomyces aquaticus]|uniref:Uncharacterized protein n=1 Tax=Clohesyomyces aquaticus TaxID=1231657 RepID=A0A1Y1YTQ1_9PLEO|nr:hypothetical protein BCR34DRAFT_627836 [Clohesyomyces aquaticus]